MSAHDDSAEHETKLTTSTDAVRKQDADYGSIGRTRPTPRRHGYVAVEVIALLYFGNAFYLISHQQFYLRERAKLEYDINHFNESHKSNNTARENAIQTKATTDLMIITLCMIVPASITALLMGGLSDVFGRKMLMYLSLTGAMIYCINVVIVVRYSLSVYFLCIGVVAYGLGGAFATMMTALFSTVADITEPGDRRSWRMILLSFILFLASALGASISGIWIDRAGYLQPLYLSVALDIAMFLVVILLIPETHQTATSKYVLKENLSIIKKGFNFYFAPSKNRTLVNLCLVTFFTSFAVDYTKQMILNLFLLTRPFFWSTTHITLYSAVRVLLSWFIILFTTWCLRRFMSGLSMALVGVLSNIVSLLLTAASTNDAMMYVAGVASLYAQATGPIMRGFMSSLAAPDQQGSVFCVIELSEMVSTAVLTMVGGLIYEATLAIFPGFVFIALAIILLFVAVALFIAKRIYDRRAE
ncbi:solute carrier family 46 member 3-like [Haliotis rufescens]|uniref:solute carrier family 46 member 3-like n=1 Tax=Haliotis rufescens TaxID=6454 RepID=UPI00201F2BB7|nr:solute carrier family 46 member 3-like [Haliotis rufescens]